MSCAEHSRIFDENLKRLLKYYKQPGIRPGFRGRLLDALEEQQRRVAGIKSPPTCAIASRPKQKKHRP